MFVPSAMQQPAQGHAVRLQGANVFCASTLSFKPSLLQHFTQFQGPGGSHHKAASGDLLDAMVAGGAFDYTMPFPILYQAFLGFLLSNLLLVLFAALVAVPLHTALSAPIVPACIADQR